jgi:S-methyl-5-thioribose kinase
MWCWCCPSRPATPATSGPAQSWTATCSGCGPAQRWRRAQQSCWANTGGRAGCLQRRRRLAAACPGHGNRVSRSAAPRPLRLCRSQKQCLLHNDLHAGNLMATPTSLHLLDWEFATFGPPAFDLGSLFANLLLARACQLAAAPGGAAAPEQGEWLLQVVAGVWEGVCRPAAGPSLLDVALAGSIGAGGAAEQRQEAERQLLADTLGFAGMCVLRQVVGMHHYQGFGTVTCRASRAACERLCLELGVQLLTGRRELTSMGGVVECVRGCSPTGS